MPNWYNMMCKALFMVKNVKKVSFESFSHSNEHLLCRSVVRGRTEVAVAHDHGSLLTLINTLKKNDYNVGEVRKFPSFYISCVLFMTKVKCIAPWMKRNRENSRFT